MSRINFFKRCCSIYILLNGLMVGQSPLSTTFYTAIIYSVMLLILLYLDFLRKYKTYAQVIIYVVLGVLAALGVSPTLNPQGLILGIFWCLILLLPQFILKIDETKYYWIFILITGLIASISLVLSQTEAVIVVFFAHVISLIFLLYSAMLLFSEKSIKEEGILLVPGYLANVMLSLPPGLLVSMAIFFMFPRLQGFSSGLSFGNWRSVGYSGTVSLVGAGPMQNSTRPIMYVQSTDKHWLESSEESLLLRGRALNVFNGIHWSQGFKNKKSSNVVVKPKYKDTRVITIQNLDVVDKSLFYPGRYIGVWFFDQDFSENYSEISGDLVLASEARGRFKYSLLIGDIDPKGIESENLMLNSINEVRNLGLEDFLDLPTSWQSDDWFKRWLEQLPIKREDSIESALSKLKGFFLNNYQVSLEASRTGDKSLRQFLLESKVGHCEYFATAAALALRSFGVPTRVVVGFKGGTYNSLVELLEVKSSDAHAWVEYWHPKIGWESFDPTPATENQMTLFSYAWTYINAIDYILKVYVTGYDGQVQKDALSALQRAFEREKFEYKDFEDVLKRSAIPAVGAVSIMILFFISQFLYRTRQKRPLTVDPVYYRSFQKIAKKKGFIRKNGETYRQFHNRIKESGVDAKQLDELTELIELILYSNIQDRKILLEKLKKKNLLFKKSLS